MGETWTCATASPTLSVPGGGVVSVNAHRLPRGSNAPARISPDVVIQDEPNLRHKAKLRRFSHGAVRILIGNPSNESGRNQVATRFHVPMVNENASCKHDEAIGIGKEFAYASLFPTSVNNFQKVRDTIKESLSKPPNQYQYEDSNETRAEVIDIASQIRDAVPFRLVSPLDLAASIREIEEATGTRIAFFESSAIRALGFTPVTRPDLIFINAASDVAPRSSAIVHELPIQRPP